MEEEQYDSIQLTSLSEVTEIYYQVLKKAMESSATETKKKKSFDGSIQESAAKDLFDFAERNEITSFSQFLTELLALLEWQNEKKNPAIEEVAIYNSLLRLEKAANNTSSWELYGKEDDGPLIAISNFEMNMLEQNISMYLVNMLNLNTSPTLFFPLTNLHQPDVIVKWRILQKIASIKITPEQTIYKQKLAECLKKRIQDEASLWLDTEFQKLKLAGKSTVLKDVELLTKILKDLRDHMAVAIDDLAIEETLFNETQCCYFDCISRTLDEKLYPVSMELMTSMDIYQDYHKCFHINLRDSCALSHAFYIQIKHMVQCLKSHRKSTERRKIDDYNNLFVKFFMNLLQVMQSECHFRIKRAVDIQNKDTVHTEERILSSSVIVLNCICTVIDEWKHLDIEEEDLQVAFLIKIADIICDGAKIFAEALDHRLQRESDLMLKMSREKVDEIMTKKICVLANSVEHVQQYLKNLPYQMQWEETLHKINEATDDPNFSKQILRILNLIHQSMTSQLKYIVTKMTDKAISRLLNMCEKLLGSWIQGTNLNQGYERFMCSFNDYLEPIEETLKDELFLTFVSHLKSSVLMYIQNHFYEGQPPEYAKTIKENLMNLLEFFNYWNVEESDTQKPILHQLINILDLNSMSTVDLQLDYYSKVAESIVSPVEYLGHIAFQAGYKATGEETVDLYINIQKGQRLPARKFEMDEIYIKLELCPSFMFPNQVPLKSTSVTEELDNPVFNQFFQFSNLPLKVFTVKGAVIQVLVLNQDKTFSAEAVLLLNQVQNTRGFASVDFLPVYLMPLKKFDMSQISYQVLENRSRWDKTAKLFINSRKRSSKQQKFMSCIPGKTMCSS